MRSLSSSGYVSLSEAKTEESVWHGQEGTELLRAAPLASLA